MNWIKASEARKQSALGVSSKTEKELNDIFKEINRAVEDGLFGITINFYASTETINKLIFLGYDAKSHTNQREGDWTTVKW